MDKAPSFFASYKEPDLDEIQPSAMERMCDLECAQCIKCKITKKKSSAIK